MCTDQEPQRLLRDDSSSMPATGVVPQVAADALQPDFIPRPPIQSFDEAFSEEGQACRDERAQEVAQQALTTIEVADSEGSEGYDPDDAFTFASTSLSSGARSYAFENGRRYHSYREGQYALPNDEAEQDREDMKNELVMMLCNNQLHFSPLSNPQEVLDIGTGTGIWPMNMGDQYPSASVLGIDLSPIQPLWIPPNVRFFVDDAESTWVYPPNHFDYIHARHTSMAIKNMPRMLDQCMTHIKPGGWVELQEFIYQASCDDSTMHTDYPLARWLALQAEGLTALGVDVARARQHATMLQNSGFTNVEEVKMKVPIGVWPKHTTMKKIGLFMRTVIYDGLQGTSLRSFTKGLGWTTEELEVFLVDVRKSLMDKSTHSYFWFHVTFGQKPVSSVSARAERNEVNGASGLVAEGAS